MFSMKIHWFSELIQWWFKIHSFSCDFNHSSQRRNKCSFKSQEFKCFQTAIYFILFYKIFTKQHHCLFAIHCNLAKNSMFQNQFIVLCNSSGSGHVTKSVNLIGWPAFFTVLWKIEPLSGKKTKTKCCIDSMWVFILVWTDKLTAVHSISNV